MIYTIIGLFVLGVILAFAGSKKKDQPLLILGIVLLLGGLGVYIYSQSSGKVQADGDKRTTLNIDLEGYGVAELLNKIAPDKKVLIFGASASETMDFYMKELSDKGINAVYVRVFDGPPIGMPLNERISRFAEALKNHPDAGVIVFRSDAPVTKEVMPIFKKDFIMIQTGGILNEELFNSGRISAYISKKSNVDLLKLSSDPAKAFAEGYTVRISN